MTRLLIISGLIGLAIAGVAIGMEETGIWQMRHSFIFFAIAFPGIGLPWHLFLWRRKKFKLSYEANNKGPIAAERSGARRWIE